MNAQLHPPAFAPFRPAFAAAPEKRAAAAHLENRIRRVLSNSGYPPLSSIVVSATLKGEVHLRGRVATFHLKQVAQATAMRVAGVRHLHNHLDVP